MYNLNVKTNLSQYPIYILNDFSYITDAICEANLADRKAVIITDTNVKKLYLDQVKEIVSKSLKEVSSFCFTAGEQQKNLDTVTELYKFFVENKLDRKSLIIALGGGVTGDMAGFAAATYLRGVDFIQIPTTLLSQVDSSVGGKVGVDFLGNKNYVGAFYQPRFVYINSSTLNTLPSEEFFSGMGEVVKHGLIQDESYYHFLFENYNDIMNLNQEAIQKLIYGSCKIKAAIVSQDEKEQGLRELLNFGHTFGHAIESLSNFTITHGKCVSIGMKAAIFLSYKKGFFTREEFSKILSEIELYSNDGNNSYLSLCQSRTKDELINLVYNQMIMDKKTKNNHINLVLLNKIGQAYRDSSCNKEEIMEAIESILI